MKHENKIKIMILLVTASMLFGFVPAGYAQDTQDWSDPINLSMSGSASNPSMVVDSEGTLHVIWADLFDGFKYSQSPDGLTWTAPVTVRFPFSAEGPPPVLFSDSKGAIHIFWLDDLNKLVYAQTLNANLAVPPGWRRRVDIDNSVYDFDMSLDAQGRMHVAYLKNPSLASGRAGVFYRKSSDGGINWAASELLYESSYFRSLTSENARVRMAVSENPEQDAIYVVWDDRNQKRIFIDTSIDGGETWGPIKELVAPRADQGARTPYNANIDVLEDKVLATWLIGEAGGGCSPFSWFSSDGGETWGEQAPILPESAQCPERSEFIPVDPGYSATLLTTQGEFSLSVWDGTRWSSPQVQSGLSTIENPTTFSPILLGCKQATISNGHLYIVGCDQGTGGDIWFISRYFGPLDDLFPLPSEWKGDANVAAVPRRTVSLTSITDSSGNVHAVWIQSPYGLTDSFVPRIEYSRWNGSEWAGPSPIVTNKVSSAQGLALGIDRDQRLLLSWVNPHTNELLFSWASAERANAPLEWAVPTPVPVVSNLTSSPYMLVDAVNRIVIAYAVSLNEGRGIYVVQSVDSGETWSAPVKAFDAVAEGWEMVDQPKLAVTGDGALNVLFTRFAVLTGEPRPMGLYYSRSENGGTTWSPPEAVSEQPVHWSEIVAYQGVVHRLWQENNRLAASTNHQTSLDGGLTWNSPVRIPGDSDLGSSPSVTVDFSGSLHFLQVIKQENHVFQEWEWAGEGWRLLDSRNVSSQDLNSPAVVESGITTDGMVYALVQLEEQLDNGVETELLSMSRSIDIAGVEQPLLATISTPAVAPEPSLNVEPQPTSSVTSPAVDLSDPEPRFNRNIIGLVLITLIVLIIVVLAVPRRNKGPY